MDKKTRMIGVRVTEEEYQKLKDLDINISTILRNAVEEKLMSQDKGLNTKKLITFIFFDSTGKETSRMSQLVSPSEMSHKIVKITEDAEGLGLRTAIQMYPGFEVTLPSSQKAS